MVRTGRLRRSEHETPGLKLEADRTENIATDGTDDAWLLVKVPNVYGKPIRSHVSLSGIMVVS